MISVLNRRQPLNGNKYIVLFLTIILFVSCGAFKKIGDGVVFQPDSEPEEVVVIEPKETKSKLPEKDEKTNEKLVYATKFFKGELYRKVPVHDKEFDIVVMLPFHSKGPRTGSNKVRGDLMLEYYQGIKLAFSEVEELGSKFNIRVYDTQNDTEIVESLLRLREVQNSDLIIGPTSEDQIRIVAYFAKKQSIPVFSPITSDATIWSENNFLFNLNPSPRSQAQEFIRYYKQKHSDKKLLLIRDGKRFDKTFGEALEKELAQTNISYVSKPFSRNLNWKELAGSGEFVVLHTAQGKTDMTFSVNSLLDLKDRATLIGPDSWLDFSSVDFNYWQDLNIRFITTNTAEIHNDESKVFSELYKKSYNGIPSSYAYLGYDHFLFACQALDAFGTYFPLFLENKRVVYSNTSFYWVKQDFYYQNQHLKILKMEDFGLEYEF